MIDGFSILHIRGETFFNPLKRRISEERTKKQQQKTFLAG
jgi:hypothetical protein